ncbi:MAG: Ldh family oxidoreductase [Burkholderiales bacterium]
MATHHLDPAAAARLAARMFVHRGMTADEARVVAEHLVGSNLAGHDSHGYVRVIRYWYGLEDGGIVPRTDGTPLMDAGPMLLVDACQGPGQWVTAKWTAVAIERAKAHGLSLLALRRSAHLGRVGHYAEMAADAGLVSMFWVNVAGSFLVAPFGGTQRMLSTAPVSVGVPRPDGEHVILDFATALVAEGKLLVAAKKRTEMPFDALIAPDGSTSGDPAVLYGDTVHDEAPDNTAGPGAILPFGGLFGGGHKGSGLAVMCELLGGVLTGTGLSTDDGPVRNGLLGVFVDPRRLDPEGTFDAEVTRAVEGLRRSRPIPGVDGVMVAGDPERRARAARLRDGFPMPASAWAEIAALARRAGVPEHEIEATVRSVVE